MAGWEPTSTTTYEYDRRGRVVRTTTTSEPEWSDEDRAWAAALDLYEAQLCSSCGGPRSECRGEDNAGRYEAAHEICVKTWLASMHQSKVVGERDTLPAAAVHAYTRPRQQQ